eukprot:CAMPEP_0178818782 /NCGR_PEP_ID=MMETSP0746-20121128/2615_1 /TAXON_ID=913974 /ORGANISM="Nitzschia punctata, Strain CCMP561" /LENGTH=44 /DNA_ID= /DNA_START= /DNA_END= /DNA_ORIENTATION=
MTSSGAPFTIWNNLRMKPDGTFPPASALGEGVASLVLDSVLMVV